MKIKDVDLETIGSLKGKVRIVSNTLKVKMENSSPIEFFGMKNNKELSELFMSIKKGEYIEISKIFYFISILGEDVCRNILKDIRFYYETENDIITFKEWALTKTGNINFIPKILIIDGTIKNCEFEKNTEYCVVNTIQKEFNNKPLNALRGRDIRKFASELYNNEYMKYIKKLRTVYKFDLHEDNVRRGELKFGCSSNRS